MRTSVLSAIQISRASVEILTEKRTEQALQDANAGVKLLSKNAPFKPEQFAERPCLEGTAARSVRRFGVTNFRYVTQSSMIQMFVQRRKKLRAGLFSRGGVSTMDAHPGFDEGVNQPRPDRALVIDRISGTRVAFVVLRVSGFAWGE